MADPSDKEWADLIQNSGGTQEVSDDEWGRLIQGGGAQQHGLLQGTLSQAVDTGTLNLAKNFKSAGTIASDKRFAKEHPYLSFAGQAAGFVAPMFTPAGWVARTPMAVAKAAEWALPFANFSKAVAPGVGIKTMLHQSGVGALKTGAWMRANEPVDPREAPPATGDILKDTGNNVGYRAMQAIDPKKMGMDYGLGAVGGGLGNLAGSAVGSSLQKVLDLTPRFSYSRGAAGNGFYDWTRGGAQRANEALTGDLRPGQSIEEATTHGMLGDFRMRQPSTGTKSGFANASAPHGYKFELAQRYSEAIDSGLTPAAARAKVASDIIADPQLIAKFNLRGRGGTPAQATIENHVAQVANGLKEAQQFPTTLQERVALSQGGTSPAGKPTYGAAPNSYAAVDEMLTSPGSKDPGSARAEATNWIGQRQQTQGDRVQAYLRERVGEGDFNKALAEFEGRRAAAYDMYDPAIANWKANPKAPDELQRAIAQAIRDWRERPENFGMMTTTSRDTNRHIQDLLEKKIEFAPQDVAIETQNISKATGQPITRYDTHQPMPEIRTPNDLQKFIAQRSNFAREAEKIRLSDPALYRVMKQFQKEHLDPAIRPLAPDWADANDLAAMAHSLRRAFTGGETFPFGAGSRQATELAKFAKLDQEHKTVFLSGISGQLQKRLSTKTSTGDQHVLFAKKETGDALRALLGDKEGNALLRELQAVAAATKTNKIFAQSATHGRESEERANRSILRLVQSLGNAAMHPLHGLGELAKWGGEKMATEAARARNDRALRILTANTDDLPNYFRQIKDVTDSKRNHLPAVTQRMDELLRRIATITGAATDTRP